MIGIKSFGYERSKDPTVDPPGVTTMKIQVEDVHVPGDVPDSHKQTYIQNYLLATRGTGRLMMFAGDQKIEHLNDDFVGATALGPVAEEDHSPEHLFQIASKATIGVFATQLGLIAQYGQDFPSVTYIAKLNSKSHLVKAQQHEPLSRALWRVEDVLRVKETSGLQIAGIGYTCYLGSEFESDMLAEAAQLVHQAHRQGLLSVIWMYPRGKAVPNEKDPHLIAGACGVAVCLGADFVKVNYPLQCEAPEEAFKEAVWAAGRTGVICAGGESADPSNFLLQLHKQIHIAGAVGNATGRNIHQRSLDCAVRLCNAISAITLGDHDHVFAEKVYRGEAEFSLDN